jgi:hypothetical protein
MFEDINGREYRNLDHEKNKDNEYFEIFEEYEE